MRLRRLLVLLAATLLLVSGCGGDNPEPKPMPKPSSTPTSSSPTPPAMPEAAKQKNKKGAITFTRTFIATLNYSGSTGDTKPLRSRYMKLCTRCEAIADSIDKTYEQGGYFKGGDWKPTRFKFYDIENGVAILDAFVTYDRQEWVKRRGAKPTLFPSSANNLKAFNLRWGGANGWRVSALDPTQ